MGKINPGKKTLGRMELIKDDPNKPRGRKNVGIVKQDPEDGGRLGTRKRTGDKVGDVVARSSKTGKLRTRKNTNLSKFPKPRPIKPTPTGLALALLPLAVDHLSEEGSESFKNMKEVERNKMRKTIQNIKGTPAELAADKKRADSAKEEADVDRRVYYDYSPKPTPKPKPKVSPSTEKSTNPEVYVDSTVTYDMDNMPKKRRGGKVSMGRGMGKALRGGGKVVR